MAIIAKGSYKISCCYQSDVVIGRIYLLCGLECMVGPLVRSASMHAVIFGPDIF